MYWTQLHSSYPLRLPQTWPVGHVPSQVGDEPMRQVSFGDTQSQWLVFVRCPHTPPAGHVPPQAGAVMERQLASGSAHTQPPPPKRGRQVPPYSAGQVPPQAGASAMSQVMSGDTQVQKFAPLL